MQKKKDSEEHVPRRVCYSREYGNETTTATSYQCRYGGLRLDLPVTAEVTFMVPWGGERHETAGGLWDTGATDTTIGKHLADKLGIVPLAPTDKDGRPMTTANMCYLGTAMVDIAIGCMKFVRMNVKVMDFDPDGAHGEAGERLPDILIGMDVIVQGRFEVDSTGDETVLTFEPEWL